MTRSCALLGFLFAWVLWHEATTTPKDGRAFTDWYLVGAEETKKECSTLMRATLVRSFGEYGDPSGFVTVGDTWAREKYESRTTTHQYWCLPNGTDPRPRP